MRASSKVCSILGAAVLLLAGCSGQQPAEDPVATPAQPDARGEDVPGQLACESGEFDEPLELANLEAGWSVSEGFIVDGCTTADQVGWQLAVDGEPVADGTVEISQPPAGFSFALEFDTELAGAPARLEIEADNEPAVDVPLELVGLADPGQG